MNVLYCNMVQKSIFIQKLIFIHLCHSNIRAPNLALLQAVVHAKADRAPSVGHDGRTPDNLEGLACKGGQVASWTATRTKACLAGDIRRPTRFWNALLGGESVFLQLMNR